MLNDPIVNGFNLRLQEGAASIRRIFEIMDTEAEIVSPLNAFKLQRFEKGIDLKIDRFQYPLAEEQLFKILICTLTVEKSLRWLAAVAPAKPRWSTYCRASTTLTKAPFAR